MNGWMDGWMDVDRFERAFLIRGLCQKKIISINGMESYFFLFLFLKKIVRLKEELLPASQPAQLNIN